MAQSPRGDSREVAIGAKSDIANTYVPLESNPTTKALKVDSEDSLPAKSPTGINGAPATVGTTAVAATFTGTTRVISFKSKSTNTGVIWFGPSTVDNTGANAYGELTADSAITIELDDSSADLYLVSDVAAQVVYKVALV